MDNFPAVSKKKNLQKKLNLLLFLICASFTIALFIYESKREERSYQSFSQVIENISASDSSKLTSHISAHKKIIQFLSELPSIKSFIDSASVSDTQNALKQSPDKTKTDIKNALHAILKQEAEIRQARIIFGDGMEYIRIERNNQALVTTPPNLLQSKQNRQYFKIGMTLDKDQLYISKISPNYEHGKVEYPLWPTYRIIKALKNNQNQTIALIVLNIDASQMLSSFNQSSPTTTMNIESYLIDANGYYLAAPTEDFLFGGDLAKKSANWFVHTEQQVPLHASQTRQMHFKGQPYFFSIEEIRFSNDASQHYYLLTGILKNHIDQEILSQRKELFISIFSFIFLILLIVYFFIRHIKHLQGLYIDQSRFKAIISNSSDAILSIDSNGIILSWNHAATLLFGLSNSEALGKCFFDLLSSSTDTPFNHEFLESIISKKTNARIEVNPRHSQKKQRTLLLTICPIENQEGLIDSVALIIRDISYEKENQLKLQSINHDLDEQVKKRTEDLEFEKQKAQRANQIKSMFVANISHEIRTPLNGINGLLSLARDKANSDKLDDYLKMAQDSTQTLNYLINDLLDFSKIESGKLELNPQPFNLIELLENVISSVAFLIKHKNIELILDVSRVSKSIIFLDENRVKQILTNLLSNAIKFTTEGEVILTASTYRLDNKANTVLCDFQVIDTGVGIPQEQQSKLFKPFTQASSGIANKYGGTGLGLSISKQLCELMKGSLTLESKSNEGSTFKAVILSGNLDSSLDENPAYSFTELNVGIFVKNNQTRRVLRNQLHSWEVNCVHFNDHELFYDQIKQTKLDVLLIDYDLLNIELFNYLKSTTIRVISLSKALQSIDSTIETEMLAKPILPSKLISILSGRTPAPIQVTEKTNTPLKAAKEYKSIPQKVFVVDDNEINRIVGKGILSNLPVEVMTANNGEDIIEQLKNMEISDTLPIILMDCQMPIMDGYVCTRLIREGKAGDWLKQSHIIAMTADAMSENQKECRNAGMDDFIGKPFDPEKLKEMILLWSNKRSDEKPSNIAS